MNSKLEKEKVQVPVPKDETQEEQEKPSVMMGNATYKGRMAEAIRDGAENRPIKSYRPEVIRRRTSKKLVYGAIPVEVFSNRKTFIETSRKGIPGHWVKSVVTETGMRETFLTILNVASSNLSSRVYQRKALGKETSEEVLDAVRLIKQAEDVWESRDMAIQWLKSPVPALDGQKPITLFDTFEGREWVSQVLTKIEYGDFS